MAENDVEACVLARDVLSESLDPADRCAGEGLGAGPIQEFRRRIHADDVAFEASPRSGVARNDPGATGEVEHTVSRAHEVGKGAGVDV